MNWHYLSLGVAAIGLFGLTACSPHPVSPNGVINHAETQVESKLKYILGNFSQVEGTDYLMAPVYLDVNETREGLVSSDYGKTDTPIRNYLFFDRNTLSTTKLFPDAKYLIVNLEKIGKSVTAKNGNVNEFAIEQVKHLWYQVVKADTNGNKNLDRNDRVTIAISDPAGNNYQELVKDIDRVVNVHVKNQDIRILFYQSKNKYFAAEINLDNRQIKIQELPSLDK
jgi:hypothetical protein